MDEKIDERAVVNKLIEIQQALVCNKDQKNEYGGYLYRSCEDILEALKPLLQGAHLSLSDEVVNVGGWNYVQATASLGFAGRVICVTAYAREAETQKGMNAAQITGSASSYARKYALNGMFLIDDNKDPDATNDHGKGPKTEAKIDGPPKMTTANTNTMNAIVKELQKHLGDDVEVEWDKVAEWFWGKYNAYPKDISKVKDATKAVLDNLHISKYTKPSDSAEVDAEFDKIPAKQLPYLCSHCGEDMTKPADDGCCIYCHKGPVIERGAK